MTESVTSILIIPFYNEANRVSVQQFSEGFNQNPTVRFLLVNDGSRDNTLEILNELKKNHANVLVLHQEKNSGKAQAIRSAVLSLANTDCKYIGYLDADLATPISEWVKMLDFITKNETYALVMGSRINRLGATIRRYAYRHYLGRFFATLISGCILKVPVYDTQCGAKILKKELALQLFENPFLTKWLFDVELLLRYKKMTANFHQHIYEFCLGIWTEQGQSKITLKDLIGFPYELLKIRKHYG